MATASYGAASRQPVFSGKRRVPGLYERTLANGATVYEAKLRLGGKLRRHRLEAQTKTDAIAELRALQVDYDRGEQHRSPATALTVDELAADFLRHLETRVHDRDPKRRFSARTVELYRQRLEDHLLPEFGAKLVADVGLADMRRLVDRLSSKKRANEKKLSPSTIHGTLTVASSLFRFAVKSGHAQRNPVRELDRDDRPAGGRLTEPRYLTPEEIAALLAQLGDTFRPVAAVCVYAGLRVSEALGLRWRDLDLKAGTLTVSGQLGAHGDRVQAKTEASEASLQLLPALVAELRAHRSREAALDFGRVHRDRLVFQTANGKPQSRRNALRAVHAAGDAAGLNPDGAEKIGIHDLRHSFAAIALKSSSLGEAAALLRHANAKVTAQVYAGVTDRARESGAAKLIEAGFGA